MQSGRRVSIKDVAAAANVSVTTVSHVLNQKGRVDSRTRERVLYAAEQLGYIPNRMGQGLGSGRSLTLGLSLPSVGATRIKELLAIEWYSNFAVLASAAAIEHGYLLAVLPALQSDGDVLRYGLDGVVVLEPSADDPRVELLQHASVPHVTVGRDPTHMSKSYVSVDVSTGGHALFNHLIGGGARTLLVLSEPEPSDYVAQMVDVAQEICRPAGATLEHVTLGDHAARSQQRLHLEATVITTEALQRSIPVDAIVCLFEGGGATVLAAAQSLGRRVPDELRIAQDVDDSTASRVTPAITVLDQHPELQAEAVVDLLIRVRDLDPGATCAPARVTPLTLVVREST